MLLSVKSSLIFFNKILLIMLSSSLNFWEGIKYKMQRRWQLFHATDFQSLMYPCFTFCRILGLFPYKINASTFKASKSIYIWSTIVTCVSGIFHLATLYGIIVSKTINYGDLPRNLEATCWIMLSGFIVISSHVLSGPRMRLLQTILKISLKLPSESYQKLSKLIHVKDILINIFLFVQAWIYFSKRNMGEINCFNIIFLVFAMYFTVMVLQINMLYMNCVCVLKACFKRINDDLARMQILVINNMKSCVPGLICHMQGNHLLLVELKSLKKWHLMISDTVQSLNVIFGLQLLATVVMSFNEITFELYSYIVRWQNGFFISLDRQIVDVFLTSMSYYIVKIMLLVWVCETGKNQAREISTTIHDVLNSTSDEQVKDELQLFSLQILHRENTFSVKGLTVDATLLTTMVGGITTYMLILIQFLITSHSCDK